jgi:hypothetical protein
MDTEIRPELVDDMVETYVEWREECLSLRKAYRDWLRAPLGERALAFAVYGAALDREEQASSAYAQRVNRIAREPVDAPRRSAQRTPQHVP